MFDNFVIVFYFIHCGVLRCPMVSCGVSCGVLWCPAVSCGFQTYPSEPILNTIVNVIKTFTKRLCARWEPTYDINRYNLGVETHLIPNSKI